MLAALFVPSAAAPAAVKAGHCYVDGSAGGGNTGATWGAAYTDLQVALANPECTEIWVAEGAYSPTPLDDFPIDDLWRSFALPNGVAVYGGFAGDETALSQRDWADHPTILSGDLAGDDTGSALVGYNSYHVVTANGAGPTTVLDGFTIRSGAGPDTSCEPFCDGGGGLYNLNSSPILANLVFTANQAGSGAGMYNNYSHPALSNVVFSGNRSGKGGGMYNRHSSPTLTGVTFSGNTADYGAGMYNEDSSPTLLRVTFTGNSTHQYGSGGGMVNQHSHPALTDVTFDGNHAGYGGGMVNDDGSDPTLLRAVFSGNTAYSGGGLHSSGDSRPTLTEVTFHGNVAINGGGAISSGGGMLTLERAIFSENVAQKEEGGAISNFSTLLLTDVAFIKNTAGATGGAINNLNGAMTMTKVTFSQNQAGSWGGGAIYSTQGSLKLTNGTFGGNQGYNGGALYLYRGEQNLNNVTFHGNVIDPQGQGGAIYYYGSLLAITNSILWGDAVNEISLWGATFPAITDSVVQGGCPPDLICTNILTGGPNLGPLQDNGGFTPTNAIHSGSAAIDSGGAHAACAAADQRGVARPQDGDGNGGAICDIGAYEAFIAPPTDWLYLPLVTGSH
jgi:predicted outer membrane repeat protein